MENLWNEADAARCQSDLDLRVYSSNLLGRSDELVLHGGGNTSVKSSVNNEAILYVKGSGWDLVSIRAEGFAPVRMEALLEMAQRERLSDTEMVAGQKAAMIDPTAPNPSVEAILHALIPLKHVDHTHADAIVTLSNSVRGEAIIAELFPDFLIVPYVMPGFILARTIREMAEGLDWSQCGGIILHHHGIFTFDDDAQRSYDKMIAAVSRAEAYLEANAPITLSKATPDSWIDLSGLRQQIESAKGHPVTLRSDTSPLALTYASQPDLRTFATRGVLTPEHILRTKRVPLVLEQGDDIAEAVEIYVADYRAYFDRHANGEIPLNPAPNYAVIENYGMVFFGKDDKTAAILHDIISHTMQAVLRADRLGGYRSIDEAESFAMEYWELEQAKLKG